MAKQKPKNQGLSERQSLLWEMINASRFPATHIAKVSGVSNAHIGNCTRGKYEMSEVNYRAVVDTIMHLAFNTERKYWHKGAL